MASSLIGALRVSLGLDTAQFEAGAKKAASRARTSAGEMESAFKSAKSAAQGLLAAFAVGALIGQIKKSLEYAGSLAEVSRTLGVTTKDLQTFRFVASQTGVSQDVLENSLRKLTVSMGKAKLGSQAQIDAFKAIGISVDQLKGKTTGDVFRLMADGLSKVTDRSQRAAIEVALLKKGGEQLDNALVGGSARINELSEAAQRLGIVLSDSQIAGAEETAHKLEAVKEVLAAQIAGVVANNATAILSLSSALAVLTGEIVRFLGSNPQLALGIVGALLGGRVGGLPGAVVGGVGGAILGGKLAKSTADSNNNLSFRSQQLDNAVAALRQAQTARDAGGRELPGIGGQASTGGRRNVQAAIAEVRRQTALLQGATAQSRAGSIKPVGVDLPKIFASPAAKAKKAPRDRSEDTEFQFAQQQRQADLEILRARQQLAGSSEQRARLDLETIQIEHDAQAAEIAHRVSQAQRDFSEQRITKGALLEVEAQAQTLQARNDQLANLKIQALVEEQLRRKDQALFEASDQRYRFTLDALHIADELATTQTDHRRIQLQILDAEIEQRRLELEHSKQLAIRNGATNEEIANIQAQIDHLPVDRAQGVAGIAQNTRGPLEEWAATVPDTAAKINEALQSIEVEGLDGLSSAITDVITGTRSLKDAFGDLAKSIISDIIQMTVKMLLFRAISSIFGGPPSSQISINAGTSNFFAANPFGGPRAGGGPVRVGSSYLVGEKGPELFLPRMSGMVIPRTSMGERLSIGNDNMQGGGGTVINQTIAPNFAGNAATHEDLVRMAALTKAATMDAIRDQRRRA